MPADRKGEIAMFKKVNSRLISCLLAVTFIVSCLTLPAAADTDQNKAQIKVAVSNENPQIGDTVTVTVSIENYQTMAPRIAAMYISVSFDTNCFDYVSSESVLKTNSGDVTSIYYDESDTVSFAYVYANSNKKTLPTTAKNIFTFKLRVKMSLAEKTEATFAVNDLEIYNGRDESRISTIDCKDPIIESMTVWTKRPDLLINGSDDYAAVYTEDVTLSFDSSSVTLSYEGRPAVQITSPYNCGKNGSYTVTVAKPNGQKFTKTFEINKEISNISVKAGTYRTDYALGITPDYSGWILLVTYRDGSHSEIQMDDPDVTITGYQPNVPGSQRLLIKYRGQSTSVNVTVTSKSVESVTIKSNIQKTEYLVGDDINTMGGVLLVFYDDRSKEEVPITAGMLSGYDKTYVGDQTVTVTYGNMTQFFNVTYYSREDVDALNRDISDLDLASIALDAGSKAKIDDLQGRYVKLNKTQKEAVTMIDKLKEAISIYNDLVKEANNHTKETTEPESTTVPEKTEDEPKGSDLKIVWYIVAGIVIVSVIGGIIYFLAIYFKKKKELDDDDYYYDDDEDEDDGSLTYDDDIDDIEDEEDETAEEEEDADNE